MATWDGYYYNTVWSGNTSDLNGWGSVVINNAPIQGEWYYAQLGSYGASPITPRSDAQQILEGWDGDQNPI